MKIRPIRNKDDYEAGFARLEDLMDAKPGTPEADEHELLATLLEKYEEERFPIEAPTPIAAIRFRMEQAGLSPRDLEPYIGSRARVSEVLSGTRPLSIDMIRALNDGLGIPADVLIRAESTTTKPSKAVITLLLKWQMLAENEPYDNFVTRAGINNFGQALLRKTRTDRTAANSDPLALHAWCSAVALKSQKVLVRKYVSAKLTDDWFSHLATLSTQPAGPKAVKSELASIGVVFVVLRHLPGTHLDGAALLRNDDHPIVALTLRHNRIDNFWFTLMHELMHVKYHLATRHLIVDDLDVSSSADFEKEADEFAQDALIPPHIWNALRSKEYVRVPDIVAAAMQARVNPAIVAGRWQREHRDFRKFSKLLGHGKIKPLFDQDLFAE